MPFTKTHGLTESSTYRSWTSMRTRCCNPNAVQYKYYGGKGITICDRWSLFQNFLDDMGKRPEGTSLDRIDNSKGYEPGNCRWASVQEQSKNRSMNTPITFGGETKIVSEWAKAIGIPAKTLRWRLKNGWPVERTLTTPLRGTTA